MQSKQTTITPQRLSVLNGLLDENVKNLRQRTLIKLVTMFIIVLSILALLSGCGMKRVVVVSSPPVSLPASYKEDFHQLPQMVSTSQSKPVLGNTTPAQSNITSSGQPATD